MTGTVESAKDVSKDTPKEKAVKGASTATPKAVAGSMTAAKPAPKAPPEQAAAGFAAVAKAAGAASVLRPRNVRYVAVAAGALVVGTAFGMISAPKATSSDSFAQIIAALESGRAESMRLGGEFERLNKSVAALAQANEMARSEGKSLGASLYDRMSKLEQGLDKKFANLDGAIEHADREQAARTGGTATPTEKRAAAPVPPAPIPAAKTEPTQTGSIAEAKPDAKSKPDTIETWALRDVYEGVAMLEDRRRRLIEVAQGDTVPGIGRVEAVERRGRMWVVVTKQGIIAPQAW